MHTFSPSFAMLLDTVLKSTVLMTLAWSAAFIMKKSSAATQHMVRTFSLIAVLLLPFSVMLLPAWHVKGVPAFFKLSATSQLPTAMNTSDSAAPQITSSNATNQAAAPKLATSFAPRLQSEVRTATNRKDLRAAQVSSNTASPAVTMASAEIATLTSSVSNNLSSATPRSTKRDAYLSRLLIGLWIAGAAFFLIRWRLNTIRLGAIVRRAGVLTDSGWNAQVRALSADLKISRHVALLISDEIEVPITTGILFPRIILSLDYPEWSPMRRSAILNHELAHIKRLDALTQALGHLATALYWFHPLVWFMVQAMRVERERACDDQVLAAGTKASDYAHELLDIVSGLREPELAIALAMARRSQLEGRVLAVLNPALPRGSVSRKAALALGALTLSIVLPLSALRPAPQASAASQSNTPGAKASKQKPSPATAPEAAAKAAEDSAQQSPNESDSFAPAAPLRKLKHNKPKQWKRRRHLKLPSRSNLL